MDERISLYRGKVVDLGRERVCLPNGQWVELEIIRHPGGAAAVALDAGQQVCLLRQYRHAAGGWLWELPAGKCDAGEPALNTAQRELAEEAGLIAHRWETLGILHSSPGILTETIALFLAWDLTPVATAHEPGEAIEVHWWPLTAAVHACDQGEITDAKTLIGLYRAAARLRAAL